VQLSQKHSLEESSVIWKTILVCLEDDLLLFLRGDSLTSSERRSTGGGGTLPSLTILLGKESFVQREGFAHGPLCTEGRGGALRPYLELPLVRSKSAGQPHSQRKSLSAKSSVALTKRGG